MHRANRIALIALFGLASSVAPSMAQRNPTSAPAPKPGGAGVVVARTTTKLTGAVKGAPAGKTFTLATPRQGNVTVDASGAQFRNRGKFASAGDLKAGAFVRASGSLQGTTMKATEVDILRLPGQKTNRGNDKKVSPPTKATSPIATPSPNPPSRPGKKP